MQDTSSIYSFDFCGLIYLSRRTFYNDHTTGLVLAVLIASHTAIFAAILRLAVDDLHRDNTVGVAHGIIMLGQFLPVLVPFHSRRWVTA